MRLLYAWAGVALHLQQTGCRLMMVIPLSALSNLPAIVDCCCSFGLTPILRICRYRHTLSYEHDWCSTKHCMTKHIFLAQVAVALKLKECCISTQVLPMGS